MPQLVKVGKHVFDWSQVPWMASFLVRGQIIEEARKHPELEVFQDIQ